MNKLLSLLAGLLLAATTSHAWVITPVWEYFVSTNSAVMTPTAAAIPILTNTWNSDSKTNTFFDGKDPLPCLGGLKRYDANRMLLAVSENGIEESPDLITTNLPLYQLSTNYPDRSLIWINPSNGLPMGLALTVGLRPVEPSEWYSNYCVATGSGGGNSSLDGANRSVGKATNVLVNTTFDFDVSDDGFVYTGYKNKLIRYRPDGSGGLLPTPELCTELGVTTRCDGLVCDTNGIGTGATDWQRWNQLTGMFGMIHVRGSGTNTLVMAGGRGHNGQLLGVVIYDTLDGTNFFGISRFTAASFSMAIPCPTTPSYSGLPGELWTFSQTYPASDNGQNTATLGKWTASPYGYGVPTTNVLPQASQVGYANRVCPIPGTPATSFIKINNTRGSIPANPGDPLTNYYRGGMIGALQARVGCPFFVAYENPSWNSRNRNAADGDPYWFKPGWIGLHDVLTGTRLGCWEQPVKESDILLGSDTSANWFGNYADLGLYNSPGVDQPDGSYEITWGSYCYGYGRYIVKNENIVVTNIVNDGVSTSTVNYTLGNTSTNNDYVLEKTTSLDGTPVWTDVTALIPWPGPYNTAGIPLIDATATETNAFYRVRLVVP